MNTTLKIELLHNGDVIGSAKMPFRSVKYKSDGLDMPLKIPIEMNDGTRGVLFDAVVYYKDFPRTAQMIGGEHNDNGIFDAQYFHAYAERPRFVKVHGLESRAEIKTRSSRFHGGTAAAVGATAASGAAYAGGVSNASASVAPLASAPAIPASRPPAARPQLPATAPPPTAPRVVGSIQPVASTAVAATGAIAAGAVVGATVVGMGRSQQPRTIQTVSPVTVRPVQSVSVQSRPQGGVGVVTGTVARTLPTQPSMPSYLAKLHPADRERTVRMGLPAPWSCHLSANGRPYYVNHQTKTTQWTPPQTGARPRQPANGAIQGTVIQPARIPVQHARTVPVQHAGTVQPQVVQPVVQPALVQSYGQPRPAPVSPYQQQFASMHVSATVRQRLPPVNSQQLGSLQAMGFDKELAQEALARNANDVQRAIMWLSTSPLKLSPAWDLRVDKKSSRLYYANREGKFTQWDRPIITQQQEPMLKSLLSMGFPRRLAVEALAHYKGDAQAATNWILYNNPRPLETSFAMLMENGRMVYLNKQNNQRYSTRPVKPTF